MQKYEVLYVKYAEVYLLHILHLYALPTLLMTLAQWQVKLSVLSESYRAHRLFANRVLDDGNVSGYCFLLPSESYVTGFGMISRDEGIHVQWDKVRLWRSSTWQSKEQRIQKIYHWHCLQSHVKSHEKESIHPIALSPNISSLEDETKKSLFLICNEKKNQIFYMLWQYKLQPDNFPNRKC